MHDSGIYVSAELSIISTDLQSLTYIGILRDVSWFHSSLEMWHFLYLFQERCSNHTSFYSLCAETWELSFPCVPIYLCKTADASLPETPDGTEAKDGGNSLLFRTSRHSLFDFHVSYLPTQMNCFLNCSKEVPNCPMIFLLLSWSLHKSSILFKCCIKTFLDGYIVVVGLFLHYNISTILDIAVRVCIENKTIWEP